MRPVALYKCWLWRCFWWWWCWWCQWLVAPTWTLRRTPEWIVTTIASWYAATCRMRRGTWRAKAASGSAPSPTAQKVRSATLSAQRNETETKQFWNCLKAVLKLFCSGFISLCGRLLRSVTVTTPSMSMSMSMSIYIAHQHADPLMRRAC